MLACLQDLSQARGRWGAAADGFFSLSGTKVPLPGIGDIKRLEAVSRPGGPDGRPRRVRQPFGLMVGTPIGQHDLLVATAGRPARGQSLLLQHGLSTTSSFWLEKSRIKDGAEALEMATRNSVSVRCWNRQPTMSVERIIGIVLAA